MTTSAGEIIASVPALRDSRGFSGRVSSRRARPGWEQRIVEQV